MRTAASAYYQRATGRRSHRAVEDEWLLERIREQLLRPMDRGGCGRRRRAGENAGRGRVERLMRAHGICGAKRRGKPGRTTRPDPLARRRPDLVDRDFSTGPNELWVADITYLRCCEGVVSCAFVIDAYSRRIVGWQLASHMRTTLVLDALRMALHQRDGGADVELVHHSDRGSTSIDYTQTLADSGVLASVGSVGDAYDKRARGELRRLIQDRAHLRSRLAQAIPARARRRRVPRLVQQRPPSPCARRPTAGRVRSSRVSPT
jgi:putative transposase